MVFRRAHIAATLTACLALAFVATKASAKTVRGTVQPAIPSGQFMSMTMTIDEVKTRFELTGPDFSYFAFGFDTTEMYGYSLIIEGTDAARTAVEQNLLGAGAPGSPQAIQNISILSTVHHAASDLTTLVIERLNNTGDPDDAIFSPNMTQLNIIGAYNSFTSPSDPDGDLEYHGSDGRGFGVIQFAVIPEPSGAFLAAVSTAMLLARFRSRRR